MLGGALPWSGCGVDLAFAFLEDLVLQSALGGDDPLAFLVFGEELFSSRLVLYRDFLFTLLDDEAQLVESLVDLFLVDLGILEFEGVKESLEELLAVDVLHLESEATGLVGESAAVTVTEPVRGHGTDLLGVHRDLGLCQFCRVCGAGRSRFGLILGGLLGGFSLLAGQGGRILG